jgi:hypothetical protein
MLLACVVHLKHLEVWMIIPRVAYDVLHSDVCPATVHAVERCFSIEGARLEWSFWVRDTTVFPCEPHLAQAHTSQTISLRRKPWAWLDALPWQRRTGCGPMSRAPPCTTRTLYTCSNRVGWILHAVYKGA